MQIKRNNVPAESSEIIVEKEKAKSKKKWLILLALLLVALLAAAIPSITGTFLFRQARRAVWQNHKLPRKRL